MNPSPLGKLERVDLRTAWETEAQNFTPWLACEENISLLGDAIGLDLEVAAREKDVGPFRADILCKETTSGAWVLIENQLERTDHNHLGQLLTYAAGLDATTIVWVAQSFTDEHRATLDWLNEITEDRLSFFGLEIELWQIGNSLAAPKFNVVSKPNDWSKDVTDGTKRIADVSGREQLYFEFWTAFRQFQSEHDSQIRAQKPRSIYFSTFPIGRAGFALRATLNLRQKKMGAAVVLLGDRGKANYRQLFQDKQGIDHEARTPLDWRELPEKKESQIGLERANVEISDRTTWPEQHQWLLETLVLLHRVFSARLRYLNTDDIGEEEQDREGQNQQENAGHP